MVAVLGSVVFFSCVPSHHGGVLLCHGCLFFLCAPPDVFLLRLEGLSYELWLPMEGGEGWLRAAGVVVDGGQTILVPGEARVRRAFQGRRRGWYGFGRPWVSYPPSVVGD